MLCTNDLLLHGTGRMSKWNWGYRRLDSISGSLSATSGRSLRLCIDEVDYSYHSNDEEIGYKEHDERLLN